MFKAGSKVVFFGAHTDDEMICAGTLHRLTREGCRVVVRTFATAATINDRKGGVDSQLTTRHEWYTALSIIGASQVHSFLYETLTPSADFQPHRQYIADQVFNFCEDEKPDVAFILSPEDENTAHRIVGEECERVMRGRVGTVIRCLFPWNYGIGRPNLFVKLEPEDWNAKVEVINAYGSQKFRYNYLEMLSDYTRADGQSVKAGRPCEKFEVIRHVW
jgi:LmbE family N-acetylglucosaminyl deacetylase